MQEKNLLEEVVKLGFLELSKQKRGYVSYKNDGIHFKIGSKEYLVTMTDISRVPSSKKDIINPEVRVVNLLRELGVPTNLLGYNYIKYAILLAMEDRDILDHVTKSLYPTVAQRYHTTSSRVERAIRHAIETVMSRGNIDEMHRLFRHVIDSNKTKPTNTEFISTLVEELYLDSLN